jgi:hypothetical protein
MDVINHNYSGDSPPHLRFEETRNAPFLDGDSSEYLCSIIRFSIQTANSLPVFIPLIDNTAAAINTTRYKITFVYEKMEQNIQCRAYQFGYCLYKLQVLRCG